MVREDHKLISQLLLICEEMCRIVGERENFIVPERIALAFFTKSTHTLKGIKILYENSLCEEAQSLIRILFETQINFSMFITMLCEDPMQACERVLDSMMLEKVKQKNSLYYVDLDLALGIDNLQNLLDFEEQIADRYAKEELKKIRKYGFTGIPIEQRAIKTGNKETYDIIYRNFSRNVHANDYVELFLAQNPELSSFTPSTLESRIDIGYQTTINSMSIMMSLFNKMFSLGFDDMFIMGEERHSCSYSAPNLDNTDPIG